MIFHREKVSFLHMDMWLFDYTIYKLSRVNYLNCWWLLIC